MHNTVQTIPGEAVPPPRCILPAVIMATMKDPNILKSKNPISVSALAAHHGSAAPRVRHTGPSLVVLSRHVTIALKYHMGYNE